MQRGTGKILVAQGQFPYFFLRAWASLLSYRKGLFILVLRGLMKDRDRDIVERISLFTCQFFWMKKLEVEVFWENQQRNKRKCTTHSKGQTSAWQTLYNCPARALKLKALIRSRKSQGRKLEGQLRPYLDITRELSSENTSNSRISSEYHQNTFVPLDISGGLEDITSVFIFLCTFAAVVYLACKLILIFIGWPHPWLIAMPLVWTV